MAKIGSEVLIVNRNAFVQGSRRAITVGVEKDLINDVFQVVAFKRGDFKPWFTPSATDVTVNSGYNVNA